MLKGAQYHPAVMTVWRLGQLDIPYMGAAGAHAARQGRAGCQLAPQRLAHGIAAKPGVPFKGAVRRPTFVSPRLPAGDQLRDYDEIDRLAAVHGCQSDHVTEREMPALNEISLAKNIVRRRYFYLTFSTIDITHGVRLIVLSATNFDPAAPTSAPGLSFAT